MSLSLGIIIDRILPIEEAVKRVSDTLKLLLQVLSTLEMLPKNCVCARTHVCDYVFPHLNQFSKV